MCIHLIVEGVQRVGVNCFDPKGKQCPLINGVHAAKDHWFIDG